MTRRGWLLFAAMAVIWGIPYLLIKVAVAELAPSTLVLLRTTVGGVILVPIALARGDVRPLLSRWRWVIAYTVVEVAAPWLLLSDAERRLSSSLAGLLIAGVPLIGALFVWIIGGDDRPDLRRVMGLVVGFVGVALVVGLDVAADDLVAVGEVGLVVVGYAIGPMIIARRLQGAPAVGVVASSLALTALAYAPLGIAQRPAALPSTQALLSIGVLGVVCTALAFLLFFALIAEVGPIRATIITYFNPAVAIVLGVLLLSEPFTVGIAAGFALIAVGSFVATRRTGPSGGMRAAGRRVTGVTMTDTTTPTTRMPALYLGHGAPILVDDPIWPGELARWSADLPKPKAILVVSAHWENAPLTIGATRPVPLVYDFYGFPQRYYDVTYPAPGAPDLARRLRQLLPDRPIAEDAERGLDHGAYVPLTVMYPKADVPVLQISMPSLDAKDLLDLGTKLAPLRDEGVLIMGSGFMTHGLPFLEDFRPEATPPAWSTEFDLWSAETLAKGDVDTLVDYKRRAPGVRYAHPTVDHFVPLFVALGASLAQTETPETVIEGYFLGLSKRSVQFA